MKWLILIGSFIFLPIESHSQIQQLDTMTMLDFLKSVMKNHPTALIAQQKVQEAEAMLLMAKGGFDPKIKADWSNKTFDGKNYYSIGKAGISVPLNPGIEVVADYKVANGTNINPENLIPAVGQSSFGLKINLGKGLLYDERRWLVQTANLQRPLNESERQIMLNELLYDASKYYLNWKYSGAILEAYTQYLDLAINRFEAIKNGFLAYDYAAADTLEAYTVVLSRIQSRNDALIEFQQSWLNLTTFLWDETIQAYQTGLTIFPEEMEYFPIRNLPSDEKLIEIVGTQHPKLKALQIKQQQLTLERKWAMEQFKPELEVSFNYLSNSQSMNDISNWLLDNRWASIGFGFPLFLRKERGKRDLIDVKTNVLNLDNERTKNEIFTKIQNYVNTGGFLAEQLELATIARYNFAKLLEFENLKFELGESSLFIINARESKLIESEIYRIKSLLNWQKNQLELINATGLMPQYIGGNLTF